MRVESRFTMGRFATDQNPSPFQVMNTPLRILVAEDDLGDVLLLKRAFVAAGVRMPVYFARDGQEVLDYLAGNSPFNNPVEYPLPNLLLLDLGLPRLNGFEVLKWVRRHPTLNQLLVVVLTSSDEPSEVKLAHKLGANAFLVKPHEPSDLVHLVERLQNYWLGINAPLENSPLPPVLLEV